MGIPCAPCRNEIINDHGIYVDITCPSSQIPTSFLENTPQSVGQKLIQFKKQEIKPTSEQEKEENDDIDKESSGQDTPTSSPLISNKNNSDDQSSKKENPQRKKKIFKHPSKQKAFTASSKVVVKYHFLESDNKKIQKQGQKKEMFTISIFGEKESGKTSFVLRFCENRFDNCYIPSFSEEITEKKAVLNMKLFKLKFVVNDVIGDADCYFVMFDYSSQTSFKFATSFIEQNLINIDNPIILIGNKSDIRQGLVDSTQINTFCKLNNCIFYPISVKNNIGISIMMQKVGAILEKTNE